MHRSREARRFQMDNHSSRPGDCRRYPANPMTFHATESFPFGDVAISCVSSPPLDNELAVQRIAFKPTLPDGMAVDLVAAYRIAFVSDAAIHNFSFDFTLTQYSTKGDANSGECLDAQSWEIGDGLLMFGTEDGDALQARMPWLTIHGDAYPVEYLPNGFRIVIPYVAPNAAVGFHFVLAYNSVDKGCDSEWFAVDVPHAKLSDFPVLTHLAGAVAG